MENKRRIWKLLAAGGTIVAVTVAAGGFAGGKDMMYHLENRGALGPLSREDIQYKNVEAPEPTSKDGTVNAKDWAEVYPYISFTMGENSKNDYVVDYLEQDPYLVNIYEGYGFAKDYGSARGHEYTLTDVAKTERPHPLANCLTCKTPNFAKMVQDQGVGVYTMPFDEVFAQMEESISCYTCHGNDAGNAGERVITHTYVTKALGSNVSTIDPSTLACGQCHIEYYFTPENKETMMPYSSLETMTPEAILAYYDEMGFSDWTQEITGAHLLKAQHPELETYTSGPHANLLNCADCHMPMEQAEDGTVYHSHTLVSPLENKQLLSTCAKCHGDTDMVKFVHNLQDKVTARETEVGNKLAEFNDALADAVKAGDRSEAELDAIRKLYREAQWFFDFCYVENAEGAHNSELAYHCLDTSEAKIKEGMKLLAPPAKEDIQYKNVKAPEPTSKDGTVNASDWAAVYPNISFTMGANSKNDYVVDYLEQDPYLVNIYEGYGFAKDYGSARGHEYTLTDVAKTERPHALANCLTCKTPNFAKMVQDQGVGVYTMPFDEVYAQMEENVSCYTCHGNNAGNAGERVITHTYVTKALGENVSTIDPSTLACGQCHIEYYFTPENKETMMPYSSLETMSPEAILAYYDKMGFSDWTQESTGAHLLKAQHPEMETFTSGPHGTMLNCADCHMPVERDADGNVYHSHTLVSPLESEQLLSTCAKCHGETDMVKFVHELQDKVTARETEVGNKLAAFNDELADAVTAGNMSEADLDAVRKLYREAQWFFDFCYVENAEGAHNSELAYHCLDTSEEKIKEGMKLLGK